MPKFRGIAGGRHRAAVLFVLPGAVALVLSATAPTQAIPVFAHRYSLSCQACHTTVPRLTAFGRRFAAAGFQLPGGRSSFPLAVKTVIAYSSEPDPGGLPKLTADEIELLSAGALGPRLSYFAEQYLTDGGLPGRTRDAWILYRPRAGELRARAGAFTLPLPVDPETQRDTLTHYAALENLFDDRRGVDLFAEDAQSGWEAHAAALSDGGFATHLYAAKTFAGGFSLHAYRYRSSMGSQNGFAAGMQRGKLEAIALVQSGGGFMQVRFAFSDAFAAVARAERGRNIAAFIFRPRTNMRLTLEDAYSDHHALGLSWLFAY